MATSIGAGLNLRNIGKRIRVPSFESPHTASSKDFPMLSGGMFGSAPPRVKGGPLPSQSRCHLLKEMFMMIDEYCDGGDGWW